MRAIAFLSARGTGLWSRHLLHGLACLLATAGAAQAQTTWLWTGATNGEWGTGSNWDLGTVPNASGAIVNINTALTVNVSDTGTGGTYPYTFGTLATNIATGSVVLGTTGTTTDILTAQTATGVPVINVATNNTTIFMYANLEGTQGFEKTGAGKLTWRFNGADQTYSGPIVISGGILGIDRNGSLGNADNDITIANGARLLAEPGSNSGTVTLPATRTITLSGSQSQIGSGNAAVNLVIEGPVGETAAGNGLVKTDAGTVTLLGPISYTGETRIAGGTLALGGAALLPAGQNLRFTQATGTLNVGSTSQTVRTIVMDNTAGNKTITGTGGSLLVNGDAALQLSGSNGVTYSFSGLDSFAFDRSTRAFNVQTVNTGSVTTSMVVNLAAGGTAGGTNSMTASLIQVGGGNSTGNNGNTARLRLGTSNTFRTGTFQVGGFNAGGVVDFQTGLTNPTLTLRGADGTSAMATWTIGETSSGARRGEGVVNLTGGSLDALVSDLRIGRHIANVDTINDTSSLTMPAGTLTASTLTMASKSNGGAPTLTSTFNQAGGTVSIGTITLGDGAGTGLVTLLPTYNLTGGSLRATTIASGTGTSFNPAATVRTLAIDGGTLGNLSGGGLTINGLDATSSGRINLSLGAAGGTFDASAGQSITIGANTALTGAGGLTKTGPGSLVIEVNAAHAGATAVNAGTLRVNGALSATSGVSVAAGGQLSGSGTVAAAVSGAGTISPQGDLGPGILTAASVATSATTGFLFDFNTANADPSWSTPRASGNDVLRLTDSSPLPNPLAAGNVVRLFLNVASVSGSDTFTGGFFTTADSTASITGGSYETYVYGNGAGTDYTHNDVGWYSLASYNTQQGTSLATSITMVPTTATFDGTTPTAGYVMKASYGSGSSDIVIDVPSGSQTQSQAGYAQILVASSVTKTGAGTVVFDAANSYTGPTTVSAGTLEVANDNAVASSAVTIASGARLAIAGGITMKAPAVTLNGGTITGGLDVNAATGITTLTINSGTIAGGSALVVGPGGLVDLPDAARVTVGVATLTVDQTSGGGKIDLGSGEIGVAAGGITAAALRADIIAGSNGGAWNGTTGITSTAAASSGGTRALGYTVAGDGSARVSFASPGDVNLDGTVDLLDLLAILGSGTYEQPVPAVWDQGDFNYDGTTDLLDLLAILGAGTYDQGNYFPAAPSTLGGLGSVAAVPEPGA
ncbi:MAG: beta strand repeat-containing protein, partial [Planctomycetota bacterium]